MINAAGITFHDNHTIDERRFEELRRLVIRQNDCGAVVRDREFFACSSMPPNNEERRQRIETSDLVIYWNGRLDNRRYLHGLLLGDAGATAISNEQLIAAAYSRWGVGLFERLIGDWALVLWDRHNRKMYLARDYAGMRPLYYRSDSASLTWASDVRILLAVCDSMPKIDSDYLYSYLQFDPSPHRTPYTDIHSVPPGSFISLEAGKLAVVTFWSVDTESSLAYRNDSDYCDHFYELFEASVRARLEHKRSIWAELSGGLDSSSIACMASNVLSLDKANPQVMNTISYVVNRGHRDDEQEFMAAVESKIQPKASHVYEISYRAFTTDRDYRYLPYPVATAGRYFHVGKLIDYDPDTTLLSGHGGDGVMWSTGRLLPHFADLLWQGRLLTLHNEILRSSTRTMRTYWDLLFTEAVGPVLSVSRKATSRPSWLSTSEGGQGSGDAMCNSMSNRSYGKKLHAQMVRDAIKSCSIDPFFACCGIERAFPFLDRRLVQFMLAIPFDQKVRSGQTRFLHRNALLGILPEAIATRQSKVGGAGFVCRAINREWQDVNALFGSGARIAILARVDISELRRALQRAREGTEPHIRELIRIIAIETWLRGLEGDVKSGMGTGC